MEACSHMFAGVRRSPGLRRSQPVSAHQRTAACTRGHAGYPQTSGQKWALL